METLEQLRTFLAWCAALNVGLYVFAALAIVVARKRVSRVHAGMFGLEADEIERQYFAYLAQYKIVVIVFSVVPYLALVAMT
ncbi:MAG: DUF6868 family protein [Planctomycetota bacterium]